MYLVISAQTLHCYLKSLLHQGLSEPEFYGDLVYKFKNIRGLNDFSDRLRKIIMRYKRIGFNLNAMRLSACLQLGPYLKLFISVGCDRSFRLLLGPPGLNLLSSFSSDFQWCCLTDQGSRSVMQDIVSVESSCLLLHSFF